MQNLEKRKRIRDVVQIALIVVFCAITIALEFVCFADLTNASDALRNTMLCRIIQQFCGALAAILLMVRSNIRLFGKPQKWLCLIPCLIVAIDNFQFSAYFQGKMQLVHDRPTDVLLFGVYCLTVGLFEECIFRGVIFSVLAGCFPQNKKGFLLTYILSSCVFGFAHLLNGFSMATVLQVGYSILMGGLFAFCLIKTKNVLCCAVTHALYNFCGLLFSSYENGTIGLGSGVVFDVGTIITMAIVGVAIGLLVLYKVFTYSEKEREELYQKLGIATKTTQETTFESE